MHGYEVDWGNRNDLFEDQLLGNKYMTFQKARKHLRIFVLICNIVMESPMLNLRESIQLNPLIF